MEFLHPAMWHDHDVDFTRWLHPAMWHVAVELWQWIHLVADCNVMHGTWMTCHWIRPVVALCNVTCCLESWCWIHQVSAPYSVTSGSGMTCHWICPNVCHIGILHLVSIPTTSLQSTCHSAPVFEILSKSDHPQHKKMTCQFSRWRISAILDFRDPIMGSLKSPGTTSYRSSIDSIALNCLIFEKIAFFLDSGNRQIWQTDRQTNKQMDSTDALSCSRYCKWRLNNNGRKKGSVYFTCCSVYLYLHFCSFAK